MVAYAMCFCHTKVITRAMRKVVMNITVMHASPDRQQFSKKTRKSLDLGQIKKLNS
ncbi:hypothetical protein HanIR_Chr08g0387951 [Helianthus annuus]|nr:hypothetical protein HanIR_Chr08g0387951 [Helianthus annuus]